jgi:hypothetical protein
VSLERSLQRIGKDAMVLSCPVCFSVRQTEPAIPTSWHAPPDASQTRFFGGLVD